MRHSGYKWRVTVAPATSGAGSVLVAFFVAMVTDSMVLTVIAFVVSMILIYIIVRKIEDVMDRAVDKVFDKVEDKIHDKFSGNSSAVSSAETVVKKEKAVAGENEWKCICGKVNQNYTSTCGCGVRKADAAKRIAENKQKALEIAKRKQMQAQSAQAAVKSATKPASKPAVKTTKAPVTVRQSAEEEWKCSCGKTNPSYVGTCMCGLRRSEVLRRREESQRKVKEFMERKEREKRGE
ncbi:MAG: hypothetical protein IKG93_13395 [Clostridiales bacterium]|nr:hypothetical protein [Clostridiales bacterium]